MIPNNSIVTPTLYSPFLPPIDKIFTSTTCYSRGGISLSDGSQGLQVQDWYMWVTAPGLSGSSVFVSADNTPATQILQINGITWARLAFDQNMHPTVSYTTSSGSFLYWFDPTVPGNVSLPLPAGVTSPVCLMDDTRAVSTLQNLNDILVMYIHNNNLVYLQQRDRFTVERTLLINVNTYLTNPFVNKFGFGTNNRVQIEVGGQLYQ